MEEIINHKIYQLINSPTCSMHLPMSGPRAARCMVSFQLATRSVAKKMLD